MNYDISSHPMDEGEAVFSSPQAMERDQRACYEIPGVWDPVA